ncbi:MAG: 3-hydroxyacyl-CoA dehydrogenase family protein [Comamonadaceae bacterium]|nr:3-hydroxyacyl-CoA dehydrogenase family protein [Comamonadaceae bacterium]
MIEQYSRQAGFLLDEGCTPAQVDKAIEKFGFAMGPFRMGDLAGNDIGWAIRKRRYVEKPDMRYSKTADLLCEMGRFGQKTGAGWYDYVPGKRDAIPIAGGRGDDRGAPRRARHHAAQDQRRRDRAAPASTRWSTRARSILEEGIASKASDIDMVYLTGYGFPLHRGGPMCYADQQGLFNVVQAMKRFAAEPARRRRRSGSPRRCWPSWPPKARPSAEPLRRTEPKEPTMTNAVIVSTARTPLAKSWKGAFNMTHGATLGGHAVKAAVERAGIDPGAVEDVLMGCANPEGATGANIARQIALRAGLPITVSGITVNRFCSSGLQTIALAAQRIIAGEGDVYRGRRRREHLLRAAGDEPAHAARTLAAAKHKPEIYWNMLQTAENVAKRYGIAKRAHGPSTAPRSQQKACAAQEAGLFNDEIAPITVTAGVADAVLGLRSKEVTVSADEGLRPGTTYEGIQRHPLGDARRRGHRRQRQPVQRRRRRLRGGRARRYAEQKGLQAAGPLPRLRGGRLRARRDGHRPGVRRAQGARSAWA